MNCFLFIFMITLTVATSNPVYDLSYGEIVDLVDNCNSLKEENEKLKEANIDLHEINGKYITLGTENLKLQKIKNKLKQKFKDTKTTLEEARTKNNALKSSNEQCDAELQNTKADLKSSQQELASAKDRITRLENKIQMLTPEPTTPETTTPEPTTPEPTTPEPTTPEPTLTGEERRVAKCGVISSIKDESITASSNGNNPHLGTQHSRLYSRSGDGGWLPYSYKGSWIEIDMGTKKTVRGIATQGQGYYRGNYWIKSFTIGFKTSISSNFQNIEDQSGAKKIFQGNTDGETVKVNDVDVEARIIRIYPITWNGHPILRFDVLLC